jgi:hypothetical protein
MGDEDKRRLILARRARFVAAALAGTAASTGACGKPEPCLSQIQVLPDAGHPNAAADAGTDADSGDE